MKIETFATSFKIGTKTLTATCQRFQVHNYPQIRVAIELTGKKKHSEIFIFYEVNSKERFYWFKLPDEKEKIAKAIAKSLQQKGK